MMKLLKFMKYIFIDFSEIIRLKKMGIRQFNEYGLRLYCGPQGSGKTISLVRQLEIYREEYPKLCIATNFGWKDEDYTLLSLEDIPQLVKKIRNDGYIGLVIGWDEIQNDFDNSIRSFPVTILRTITQQRKQGIQILATSQTFTRVAKPIREQTFQVVECSTLLGRWTFQKWYDPIQYEYWIQNPDKKNKLSVYRKINFVQDDELRDSYDSYAVIDNLNRTVSEEKRMLSKSVI